MFSIMPPMIRQPEIDHVLTFIKVVETGSFTSAANARNVSKSVASKHVSALEEALNNQLIKRTTRKLIITDAGKVFYESVKNIPDQITQAQQQLQPFSEEPHGILKVIAPANFGTSMKVDVVPEYLIANPKVTMQLQLVRPVEDHLHEDFDVAIMWRLTHEEFPDYNLIAKKLFTMPVGLYASRDYLKKHGEPKKPEDLLHHNCFSSVGNHWPFANKRNKIYYIDVPGRLQTKSDQIIHAATCKGLGVAYSYPYIFKDELKSKHIVRLLEEYTPFDLEVYVFYHPSAYIPLKITTFIEALQEFYQKLMTQMKPLI